MSFCKLTFVFFWYINGCFFVQYNLGLLEITESHLLSPRKRCDLMELTKQKVCLIP